VQAGELIVVRDNLSPNMENDYLWLEWLILANLLEGDMDLTAQAWTPLYANIEGSTPTESASVEDEEAEDEARITSMLVVLLFYAVILMASGFLMRSVSEEKKSRTIEVLLLSASPGEILTGKTIALGLVGLLQGIGWVVITYLLFTLGGMTFRLPGGIALPPEFLLGAMILFLLGYSMYASLYAGAGVLIADWRQSSGVSLLIILPALAGFEISLLAENPHSMLMVITSLFPLTAPIVMIRRLLSGGVPLWQFLLSAALMAATAYWLMRAVVRVFHAQTLLSGQPFSVRRYFQVLFGL
jgi:ABC-2 type transport system permease protein